MPSNNLILCCPLLHLPSIFPNIRVFSNESALHITWSVYWSFSFNPSSEYSALTSFRMDWFDLLAVQGILKSLLRHHSSKVSILWLSSFWDFPCSSVGKDSACSAGDLGSIPRSARSPAKGSGNPLQCSCLEKSMDREA